MIRGYRVWDNQEKTYSDKTFSIDQFGICYVQDEDRYWEEIDDSRFIVEFETGLTDKNGKEICEGDLLRCKGAYGDDFYFKVVWAGDGWFLLEYRTDDLTIDLNDVSARLGYWFDREVIGNVHEDRELLGDGE